MHTIHCAMGVFNDHVGERKSWKSFIHCSCTDLGHDVPSVSCVVVKTHSWGDRGVIGSSEGLPANVFHSWSLSFLSLPIVFCRRSVFWYVSCLETFGVPCFFSAFHVWKLTVGSIKLLWKLCCVRCGSVL